MTIKAVLTTLAISSAALLGAASVANAGTALIQGELFFGTGTPTTAYSGPNDQVQFSFDVPSSFSGSTTSDITNFMYTVDSKAVAGTPTDIEFYPVSDGGMFDIDFSRGTTINLFGADVGSSGNVGPTGGYSVAAGVNGATTTGVGFVDLTVSAVPETSTWALMIAGVAMIGGMLRFGRERRFAGPATA